MAGCSNTIRLDKSEALCRGLQPRPPEWTVWAVPRSLATTGGIVSVPPGTWMFRFPGFPLRRLCVHLPVAGGFPAGFPHSDTTGSAPAHGSPMLFAVYHVLRRLLMPRHPPFAFCRFFHVLAASSPATSCGDHVRRARWRAPSLAASQKLTAGDIATSLDAANAISRHLFRCATCYSLVKVLAMLRIARSVSDRPGPETGEGSLMP